MPTKQEVHELLDRLNEVTADHLEDQRLDFKEWEHRSHADATAKILEAVICMANGGGGTIVVGVKDNIVGLSNSEIRELTSLDREQVKYVMRKIKKDGLADSEGRGGAARWHFVAGGDG